VSERFKEHAWKACVGETRPWVRIPPSPPYLCKAHPLILSPSVLQKAAFFMAIVGPCIPHFSRALRDQRNEDGFTNDRLLRLLADYAWNLTEAGRRRDPVEALFHLLEEHLAHQDVLAQPLSRLSASLSPISHKCVRAVSSTTLWLRFIFRMVHAWRESTLLGTYGHTAWWPLLA
jgi:hypothetical protein